MMIAGHGINLIDSHVFFESAINLFSVNKRTEALDIGPSGDHLKTKLMCWESVAEIHALRNALPRVSDTVSMQATEHECPLGPAYDCTQMSGNYILLGIGDVAAEQMGVATMELEIAAAGIAEMPFKYDSLPFDISNFAVKSASRKTGESKKTHQKGEGWAAFRHGWNRPEISLSLTASSQTMGGTLRWLTEIRSAPFAMYCGPSMMLADGRREITVLCTAWGNLRRIGNSGMWECDFEFAEAA